MLETPNVAEQKQSLAHVKRRGQSRARPVDSGWNTVRITFRTVRELKVGKETEISRNLLGGQALDIESHTCVSLSQRVWRKVISLWPSSQSRQEDTTEGHWEATAFCSFSLLSDGHLGYSARHIVRGFLFFLALITLHAWEQGQVSRTHLDTLRVKEPCLYVNCSQESFGKVVWPWVVTLGTWQHLCFPSRGKKQRVQLELRVEVFLSQEQEKRFQF